MHLACHLTRNKLLHVNVRKLAIMLVLEKNLHRIILYQNEIDKNISGMDYCMNIITNIIFKGILKKNAFL